jgi:hypothetical protein
MVCGFGFTQREGASTCFTGRNDVMAVGLIGARLLGHSAAHYRTIGAGATSLLRQLAEGTDDA